MSYSRQQLYAMGEPFGECATRKEGGRIIYGGGGSSAPASQTQVTDLPDWAKPYAKEVLGKGQALTDINQNPYQAYKGEKVAGFSPLQQQSFQGAEGMQPSQLGAQAGRMAGAATMGALGTQYDPFRMGQFTSGRAAQYMNPFIEQAMEPQLREAQRSSEMQRVADMGQATRAGAFGGGRQAILEAERQRNLGTQLGDIRARGYMSAFDQAQQNFAREQQLREQSRQYGAGLGIQGLQTAITGAGQLGALGGQQFQQGMDVNKLQNLYGTQQQQQEQQRLTQAYQDFQNQQRYPYQQLEFMSNLLRGTPMGTVQTLYGGQPNNLGTLVGTGLGAYGALTRAEGGMVDSYAEGGVTDTRNVEDILDKLSDQQLQQAQQSAIARGDAVQLQAIAQEISQRASMRRGIAAGIPDQFADSMEEGMAAGGIVAFSGGGDIDPFAQFSGMDPAAYAANVATDEPRRQSILNRRKEEEDQQRIEFLRTAAPEVAARMEKERKPAAAPAPAPAPAPARQAAAPAPAPSEKATKEVKKASAAIAQTAGVSEKSIADEAMSIYERMQGLHKGERDELNKLIEAQKGKAGEIKARGLSDALMNFGFTMASKAARPGATFLGSVGEAAPAFGTSIAKTQELEAAANDNYNKLLMEQKKYEIATKRGDMKEAGDSADKIARRRFELEKLNKEIEYRNRALSVQAAGRDTALLQIADRIMAQPGYKGSLEDALRVASGVQGGVDIRTDFNRQKLLADKLEKDTSLKLLNLELNQAKTEADRAKIQGKIDQRKAAIMQDVNVQTGGAAPAAAGTVMRFDAKGNPIQ
jgi:hypothetical protein